ncbi:hypothetical protein V8E53_004759 [Lactarius tabidus]
MGGGLAAVQRSAGRGCRWHSHREDELRWGRACVEDVLDGREGLMKLFWEGVKLQAAESEVNLRGPRPPPLHQHTLLLGRCQVRYLVRREIMPQLNIHLLRFWHISASTQSCGVDTAVVDSIASSMYGICTSRSENCASNFPITSDMRSRFIVSTALSIPFTTLVMLPTTYRIVTAVLTRLATASGRLARRRRLSNSFFFWIALET